MNILIIDAFSPTCLAYFKDFEVKGPLISSLQIFQNREIHCMSSEKVRRYVVFWRNVVIDFCLEYQNDNIIKSLYRFSIF